MSTLLTIGDVEFLSKATDLTEERVVGLAEPTLNLVLNAVSDAPLDDVISKLSLNVFMRLAVFKSTQKYPFDLDEKAYVADAACEFVGSPMKSVYWIDMRHLPTETLAKYFLVSVGLFHQRFNRPRRTIPSKNFYVLQVQNKFESIGKTVLAQHIPTWVVVLNQLNQTFHLCRTT